MGNIERWRLWPSDYGGDALTEDDSHERLIATGPDVRGSAIEVVRADAYRGAVGPLLDLIRRAHDDPHGSLPISWYEQAKEVLDHHAGGQ